MPSALDYARELIAQDSVSAKSNVPVTDLVDGWLRQLDFEVERINYTDPRGVAKSNVIGRRGTGTGGLAFLGHTDVVPADDWKFAEHGPFTPTVRDGRLYGRGSTDMKGPIACFLAAASQVQPSALQQPLFICCSADEETGMQGIKEVVRRSAIFRQMVAAQVRSIVGEPTQLSVVHAHKGGCGVTVRSRGVAAHSSSTRGINANWKMIPFLAEMKSLHGELEADPRWQNPAFIPPTMSLNLGINDHNLALNITAPESVCRIYFRAMPDVPIDPVLERISRSAHANGLEYTLDFRSPPFHVPADLPYVRECLPFAATPEPQTVAYGTDAAQLGELQNCVVFGPGDIAQAHTHDEFIALSDLERGTATYAKMIEHFCG